MHVPPIVPTGNAVDATHIPLPEQVKPPAVPVPVHGVPIAGVIQIEPLQYSDPDTLPVPVQAPPETALAKATVPLPVVTQTLAVQVNPATVDVPIHALPTVGTPQVAPLQ